MLLNQTDRTPTKARVKQHQWPSLPHNQLALKLTYIYIFDNFLWPLSSQLHPFDLTECPCQMWILSYSDSQKQTCRRLKEGLYDNFTRTNKKQTQSVCPMSNNHKHTTQPCAAKRLYLRLCPYPSHHTGSQTVTSWRLFSLPCYRWLICRVRRYLLLPSTGITCGHSTAKVFQLHWYTSRLGHQKVSGFK